MQTNHAFLLTMPAHERTPGPTMKKAWPRHSIPQQDRVPETSLFKHGISPPYGILPSIYFRQNAQDVKIEPGRCRIGTTNRRVTRFVQISSRVERGGPGDVAAGGQHGSRGGGAGRKWYLVMPQSLVTAKRLTRYGEGLASLRQQARGAVTLDRRAQSGTTLRPDQRERQDRLGRPVRAATTSAAIYHLFEGQDPRRIERPQVFNGGELGKWEEANGKIRIDHAFRFGLPREPGRPAAYVVDAWVAHETVKDINPAEVFLDTRPSNWNLIQIGFTEHHAGA